MRSARHGQVSTHVDAAPDKVWEVVADLTKMGEWSPECHRVEWLDGASSPAAEGARFRGWNRYGPLRWTMSCRVTSSVPGREVAWVTVKGGRDLVSWKYRFEESGGGTELTESFDVRLLPPTARLAEDFLMRDRDRRREEAMRQTLARIKAVAERKSA